MFARGKDDIVNGRVVGDWSMSIRRDRDYPVVEVSRLPGDGSGWLHNRRSWCFCLASGEVRKNKLAHGVTNEGEAPKGEDEANGDLGAELADVIHGI
ncbi:hypothetical protein GUJ93_ZPchr0010g10333 [Zizania palustris]|uniref:Uncharacterized protein n=1 Tax=Zizania palustris TaxID=103762 RepID=A0A8J5WGX7_ZIZPA|nr:hypothetical protein GUJ93_ZPchr0010g10333 [Zizania palustris]